MYKVIHQFLDLQDEKFHYKVGDTYPRKGKKAVADRVAELAGSENKIGRPLIEEVKKASPKKKTARAKE